MSKKRNRPVKERGKGLVATADDFRAVLSIHSKLDNDDSAKSDEVVHRCFVNTSEGEHVRITEGYLYEQIELILMGRGEIPSTDRHYFRKS